MAEQVVVSGGEQAQADIARWIDQLPEGLTKVLQPFGHQLADQLAGEQPYDTGRLAGSAEMLPPTVDTFFALSLGREVEYAGWIEFGGSRGRPHVALGRTVWPTAKQAEPQFDRIVADATSQSIEQFPWHQE